MNKIKKYPIINLKNILDFTNKAFEIELTNNNIIENELTQYKGFKIDVDIKKLFYNQVSGKINKVAKLQNCVYKQNGNFYGINGISPTHAAKEYCLFQNKIMYIKSEEDKNIVCYRKLTTLEVVRLMGFPDEAFRKLSSITSNSQICKMLGNSIVVNVIRDICGEIIEFLKGV